MGLFSSVMSRMATHRIATIAATAAGFKSWLNKPYHSQPAGHFRSFQPD